MAESKRPEGSVWTVAGTAAGEYIGYFDAGTGFLYEALRIDGGLAQVNTPNGPASTVVLRMYPVGKCLDSVRIHLDPVTTLNLENDVSEDDRKEYEDLWDKTREDLRVARAQRAGLVGPEGGPVKSRAIIRP